MEWWLWLLIVVALVAVALLVWSTVRRSRLREAFGSEYDRTLERAGSRRAAEGKLRDRLRRHRDLELQPLESEVAGQYAAEWMGVQIQFVDTPDEACDQAEGLLGRVLRARGYPVDEDFDTQADLVSVDHPELVAEYRRAHETLHARSGDRRLEDLRVAFVAYRGLFSDLLDEQRPNPRSRAVIDEEKPAEDEATSQHDPRVSEVGGLTDVA